MDTALLILLIAVTVPFWLPGLIVLCGFVGMLILFLIVIPIAALFSAASGSRDGK